MPLVENEVGVGWDRDKVGSARAASWFVVQVLVWLDHWFAGLVGGLAGRAG
jgi:hypothetical protein